MSRNYTQLADILAEIRGTGGVKSAAPKSEPGGYSGPSSHPSASADDGLVDARTGARAAENTADVKADGEQPKVDAVAEAKPTTGAGGQNSQQLRIGMNPAATGDDPSTEDDYKGDKDDPGTTSIMKADDGEKYAALLAMPFDKLAAIAVGRGDAILTKIAKSAAKPAAKTAGTAVPAAPAKTAAAPAATAPPDEPADVDPQLFVADVIKSAVVNGARVAEYLDDLLKQAGGPPPDDADVGESHAAPGDAASGAGEGGAIDGAANAAGGAGGGDGAAPGGGPPGLAGATAGAPGMDAPPGAGGGPPPSREETLRELASTLFEMGIDPQELAAVAQQLTAQPAAPMEAKQAADELWKVASAVTDYKRKNAFRYAPAKTARSQALRDEMAAHVHELRQQAAF